MAVAATATDPVSDSVSFDTHTAPASIFAAASLASTTLAASFVTASVAADVVMSPSSAPAVIDPVSNSIPYTTAEAMAAVANAAAVYEEAEYDTDAAAAALGLTRVYDTGAAAAALGLTRVAPCAERVNPPSVIGAAAVSEEDAAGSVAELWVQLEVAKAAAIEARVRECVYLFYTYVSIYIHIYICILGRMLQVLWLSCGCSSRWQRRRLLRHRCVNVCVCVYIYANVCVDVHVCMYVYVCMYACIIYIGCNLRLPRLQQSKPRCVNIYLYIYIYTSI